ncbi:MAG: (d)CMP kinase [Planctomycetes bacterium]|jgi:cytidylate kinase|nr:(d)CMP kinase [Planctomycetota bacterium]
MIITIDGPAGSGKSTAARNLATRLGIAFLDTGATYRAVTLKALETGIDLADEDALCEVARNCDVSFEPAPQGLRVLLEGRDVSTEIRTSRVSEMSRYAAASPKVREVLVNLQRRLGAELGSFVTEGRDQGTVVFPQANLKVYLDADPAVRARRRHAELAAAGYKDSYESVLSAIADRDARDRGRAVGPLSKPKDAVVIDTSNMEIQQVEEMLVQLAEALR